MKTLTLHSTACVAAMVFAAFSAAPASARCVSKTSALRTSRPAMSPVPKLPSRIAPSADPAAPVVEPSIVGYWYVRFTVDDQLVDDGFDTWLSDGIEVLNDTSTPSSGNVCLGAWTKTAPYTYTLKHPSWIFDDANVNLIGVAIIKEQITLDPSGNSFTGTTEVDLFDLSGNALNTFTSDLSGKRITALDDPTVVTPIPGLPASILNR